MIVGHIPLWSNWNWCAHGWSGASSHYLHNICMTVCVGPEMNNKPGLTPCNQHAEPQMKPIRSRGNLFLDIHSRKKIAANLPFSSFLFLWSLDSWILPPVLIKHNSDACKPHNLNLCSTHNWSSIYPSLSYFHYPETRDVANTIYHFPYTYSLVTCLTLLFKSRVAGDINNMVK